MEIPKTLLKKLEEGRQYRRMVEIEVKEADDEMIVEGYATTFNEPYLLFRNGNYTFYEQVDSRAFDETDMSDVIMQYDHEGRVFARIANKTLAVEPDEHGLHVRANLGGTELGRQLYEEIKGGYTDKMSFGFTVDKDERTIEENHETGEVTITRTITGIRKLYDVSAVSLPANNATEISARSYCDGLIAELEEERRKSDELKARKQKIKILSEV